MRALLPLALLLACAGCGQPAARNAARAAPPRPVTASPAPDSSQRPDALDGASGAGGGPTNSFIVCPGNPRCPKDGTDEDPD